MSDISFPLECLDVRAHRPPPRAENMALFLDLDGTLLEIAATPDAVVVPEDLVADLRAAFDVLGGAVAIVSGRRLAEIDLLLKPLLLPAAGEHGASIRMPDGQREDIQRKVPEEWIENLFGLQQAHPGVLIERKLHSVVAHFRNAPHHAELVRRYVEDLVGGDPERFEALPGKMVFEIRSRNVNKGSAVHRLMQTGPFYDRKPVFVGDDVTDEDGFEAAVELGGMGLHVAKSFSGQPREVRRWLKQIAQS
jgi:trehalose 6-phosphate phosphatase